MALKTGLEGKPWYYALAVGLITGGLLLGGVYFLKLSKMKDEIAAQEATLTDLQNRIQEAQAAERDLPKFREEVRRLQLELDKLLRILPTRRNTPDLLRKIRSLTEQGNFTLKRFTPAQLSDRDFYSEWPIQVGVDGTYHNLALFFDKIGRFSRIINIEDLKVSAHPSQARLSQVEGGHTITAEFQAKTFVYKEPAPVTAEAPAPGSPAAAALAAPPDAQ